MAGEIAKAVGLGARIKPIDMPSYMGRLSKLSEISKSKAAKQPDVSSVIDDMVVVDGSMLPAWSDKMKQTNTDLVKKAMEYVSDGKPNPKTRLWEYYVNNIAPQQQELKSGNKAAQEYINGKGKFLVYDDVVNALATSKDMDAIQKLILEKQDATLMAGSNGGFAYIPKKPYDYSNFKKIDKDADYVPFGNPKDYLHNGLVQTTQEFELNPSTLESKRNMLLSDPEYIVYKLHDAPVEIRADEEKAKQYINEQVDKDLSMFRYSKSVTKTMNAPKTQTDTKFVGRNGFSNKIASVIPSGTEKTIESEPLPNGGSIVFAPLKESYVIKMKNGSENPVMPINSAKALNTNTGEWQSINIKGQILEVYDGYRVFGGSKEFNNPEKMVLVRETKKSKYGDELINYLVPYKVLKGKIKAFTSSNDTGWELKDEKDSNVVTKENKSEGSENKNKATKFKNTNLLDGFR